MWLRVGVSVVACGCECGRVWAFSIFGQNKNLVYGRSTGSYSPKSETYFGLNKCTIGARGACK